MRSKEYWAERMELLNRNLMQKADALLPDMEKAYQRAMDHIQKDIEVFYQRYADAEGLTLSQAKQRLSASERKAFAMTVEEYIEAAQKFGADPKWIKRLEAASINYRVTRLESLKLQMQQQVEILSAMRVSELTKTLTEIFEEAYYRTGYEIQKGLGVGTAFVTLDVKRIQNVLAKPWSPDGMNFSERIWGKDRSQLIHALHTTFTDGIIRGDTPQRMIDSMKKSMNTSRSVAGRLVMTESAAFASMATLDGYKRMGTKQFQFLSALDGSTCEKCGGMDGKVFDREDYQIGMTAPPLHPNCRCTTVPHYDDEFTVGEERAARDEKGNVYYVPADITYEEWKKAFVNGDKESLTLLKNPEIDNAYMKKAYEEFSDMLSKSDGESEMVKWLASYSQTTEYMENLNLEGAFAYSIRNDCIYYNPNHENFKDYDMNFAQAHELSHRLDVRHFKSWRNEKFLKAVEICSSKLYTMGEELDEWFFDDGGKYFEDAAFSDIISALSEGNLNYMLRICHPKDYWHEYEGLWIYLETFANIACIDVLGYESKKEFNGFLKELYEAYKEVIS